MSNKAACRVVSLTFGTGRSRQEKPSEWIDDASSCDEDDEEQRRRQINIQHHSVENRTWRTAQDLRPAPLNQPSSSSSASHRHFVVHSSQHGAQPRGLIGQQLGGVRHKEATLPFDLCSSSHRDANLRTDNTMRTEPSEHTSVVSPHLLFPPVSSCLSLCPPVSRRTQDLSNRS